MERNKKIKFTSLPILLFVIIILCFNLTGCGIIYRALFRSHLRFSQDYSEISAIQIVKLTAINENLDGPPEQTVLTTISDIEQFYSELNSLSAYSNEPDGISYDCTAVKIIYKDGEYDLFHSHGQSKYTKEYGFERDIGLVYIDKVQFYKLLSKYLGYTVDPEVDLQDYWTS